MKKLFWLGLSAGLLATHLSAAVIQFQVTDLGSNVHEYQYFVSGLTLQANQAIDLRFDPALYGSLSNGVADAAFNLILIQPNNPPGAAGDYRAITPKANPSLVGPFKVDFTFTGAGTPGSQPFLINQYSAAGLFVSTIDSGVTTPLTGVPEPTTVALSCAALLCGFAIRRKRLDVLSK